MTREDRDRIMELAEEYRLCSMEYAVFLNLPEAIEEDIHMQEEDMQSAYVALRDFCRRLTRGR